MTTSPTPAGAAQGSAPAGHSREDGSGNEVTAWHGTNVPEPQQFTCHVGDCGWPSRPFHLDAGGEPPEWAVAAVYLHLLIEHPSYLDLIARIATTGGERVDG